MVRVELKSRPLMFITKMEVTEAKPKSSFHVNPFQEKVVCPTLSSVLKRNSEY